jgi:Arc/MetJ family transcription regulator
MRTNIVIDDELIAEAMQASGLPTKRAAVEAGLRLLIQVQAQTGVRSLRGRVKWQGDLSAMRLGRIAEEQAPYPNDQESE